MFEIAVRLGSFVEIEEMFLWPVKRREGGL
jgi:hypothetical protein